jgi:hypothetical protein
MSEQSTNMTHLLGFFKANLKRSAAPVKTVKTVEPVKATVARAAVAQPRRAAAVLADDGEWEEF